MKNHTPLPILRLVEVENAGFQRYFIEDENFHRWTGERFDSSNGILYANQNHAALDAQSILKSHFARVEPWQFMVPLVVEVYSRDPVSVAEIAQYLSRASRLQIDSHVHGNGPGSSLVLQKIEWHRIQPEKESSHE